MHVPGSPSEVSDTVESVRPDVTSVRLQGRYEDDGYELMEPLVLTLLSTNEAIFSLVAADPERGTVTVHRGGTEEYWQFPLDRVASMSHTEFEFLLPEQLEQRSSVKIAALCAIVSAALIALLARVHVSTETTTPTPTTTKISSPQTQSISQAQ